MARQYKLRLRDGTILAVDQAGLRTWLIDDRAMVQPMGARAWRPLREVLAQESLAAAISPSPSAPPPRPRPLGDDEIPSIAIKPPSLEAPRRPDPRPEPRVDAFVPERLAEPSPEPPPPPRAAPAPPRPAPPRPAASPPAGPPVARAPAPAPPRAARPIPPRAAAPLVPEPAPIDAPPATEDLPIIPFKRLDDEPASPRVSVRVASQVDSLEETDLADALALVIQKEVAEGHAVVISENDLEELYLVDDEPVELAPPLPKKEAFEAEVSRSVNQLVGWARSAMSLVRAKASAARAAASAPRPQPAQPPPTLRELSVVPLARLDQPAAPKRRAMMAGLAAAVVVAAVAATILFLRADRGDSTAPAAKAVEPTPIPEPTAPSLPSDVQVAAERLPHLAPATVQLLISTSPFGSPDPADLFRRGRAALRRGTAALTPEEGQELAVLERAVLVRLGPAERERVMAYDRVRGARDLQPAEDARVLSLVARGARGLPNEQRERLQALSGKAIAAALASP